MSLATALALLITGCARSGRLLVQNKPAAVAPKETITHHFFVSELGRRKLSMQPKFVAAQKMLLKQKPSNIVNDCSVLLLCVFIPAGSAWVLPPGWPSMKLHRYAGNSICTVINILLGSFQRAADSDQPL